MNLSALFDHFVHLFWLKSYTYDDGRHAIPAIDKADKAVCGLYNIVLPH